MTILFDAAAPVKTARRFAAGLFPSRPVYAADHTAADEAWLIADNARREAESRHYDRRYSEAYAVDALCLGLIPSDAAEFLASKSIVRHPA